MTRTKKGKAGRAKKGTQAASVPTLRQVPRTPSYDVTEPRMAVNGTYVAIAFVAILAGLVPILASILGTVAAVTPLFVAGIVLFLLALRRPRAED